MTIKYQNENFTLSTRTFSTVFLILLITGTVCAGLPFLLLEEPLDPMTTEQTILFIIGLGLLGGAVLWALIARRWLK